MSDATAIATVSEIYQYVSVTSSDDEALLQNLIDRKTDMIEKYCGLDSFYIADYTEYYDGNGTPYLFVKNNPVNSVSLIAQDSDWVWGTDSEVDTADYRIVDDKYIAYKYYFTCGLQNVKVIYNSGYSVIPLDLKEVLIEEVWRNFARRKEMDVLIHTLNDGSVHYTPSGLMPSTKQVLSKYMRLRST